MGAGHGGVMDDRPRHATGGFGDAGEVKVGTLPRGGGGMFGQEGFVTDRHRQDPGPGGCGAVESTNRTRFAQARHGMSAKFRIRNSRTPGALIVKGLSKLELVI